MDTSKEQLSVLAVYEGLEYTATGELLIDGVEALVGRYQLRFGADGDDAEATVLQVADPDGNIEDAAGDR